MKVKMIDYDMDVNYGAHVIERLCSRFYGIDTAYLNYIFECLFADESIADFIINEVKIGEDVVVIDEDSGVSLAVSVGIDNIYVKTIYNAYEGNLLIGEMQKVLRYAKSKGLRTEVFHKQGRSAYAVI